ncbi:MAG TPA: hypothetical protein VHA57_06730 [Actinomycetota bacterium]|nr:hypothetical protein [Actinomycetota bacterium]
MGKVSLAVPAKPEYLHVVRAVVSGIAARHGLTFEGIQDLCLAANEAAGYLLALPGDAHRLALRMTGEDGLELVVSTDAPASNWPPQLKDSLAWRILSNLVPEVTFSVVGKSPVIRLVVAYPNDGSS